MILQRGVEGEIEIISLKGESDEVLEEEIIREGWIGARVDGDDVTFERGEEVGRKMRGCGVGHPDRLGE